MPTLDEVRELVHKGHGDTRPGFTPTLTLDYLWFKHLCGHREIYDRLHGELFVAVVPKVLTYENPSVDIADWSTASLVPLLHGVDRTRPLQGDMDAPVAVVIFRGQPCLVDGGRRVTFWKQSGDANPHKAYVVTIRE